MADALETVASMIMVKFWNEVPNLTVMGVDRPAHVFVVEEIKYEKPWYYDITSFQNITIIMEANVARASAIRFSSQGI